MKQIYTLILLLLASFGYSQCNDDTFDIPQFTTLGYLNIMCFHDNPAAYDLDLNSTGEAVRSPLLSLTTKGTGAASYNTTTRVLNIPTPPSTAKTFNNAPSRSLVTTAAAANGWQISSTKDADVSYSTTILCAVQIGVVTNVEGYVVLEISATNSTTASDWKEISRTTNAQNIGLAIALSSTQKGGGCVSGKVPSGWYCRIRSVNVSGTPTYTTNGQQEVY